MRLSPCLLFTVLWLGFLAVPARAEEDRAGPQFTVDLARYMGLWHEFARTPNDFEDNTPTEKGERLSACFNATADYTLREDGRIAILNTCTRETPGGRQVTDEAAGLANVVDGSHGRKLKIAFGGAFLRAFIRLVTWGGADYWITCLGPQEGTDPYEWAVISGPDRDFIFVLTREQVIPDALKEKALACAQENGLPVGNLNFMQRPEK